MSRNIHIIIAEPSAIVFEGLVAIFLKSGLKHHVSKVDSLDEIQQLYLKRKCELILVNPALIQNNIKTYNLLKTQLPNTQWMALVFAYYSQYLLSQFDAVITISDTPEMIVSMISRAVNSNNPQEQTPLLDVLSDREVDVLKLLASGLANKEIADKLNISINTVITHRKNISQKTGIKSVSGLTIYAVLKKLVTLENLSE